MTDEAADCPVDSKTQRWLESSLRWCADQFGPGYLLREPTLPSQSFLNEKGYIGSAAQVNEIVTHLCKLMGVSRDNIKLELFDGSSEALNRSRAVGHFRVKNGQAIIALDQSESGDRLKLAAIAVHELCHLRLLAERRIRRDRPDGERLTDLLAVFFGFGIFSTNAAMSFDRAARGWAVIPSGQLSDRTLNAAKQHDSYHRLGYLSSAEFGYALACYCWLRQDLKPSWLGSVNPGPRAYLERGLGYLRRSGEPGELPSQRFLDKTIKIGNTTIHVTHGGPGAGLLGVRFPDL